MLIPGQERLLSAKHWKQCSAGTIRCDVNAVRHAGWHELKLGNVRGRICLDVRWERMRILELSKKRYWRCDKDAEGLIEKSEKINWKKENRLDGRASALKICLCAKLKKILIKNVKKNLKNKLKKGLQCCNSRAVTKMCSQTIKTTMTRCDWCPTGVNKNLKKFLSYYESYRTYLNEPGAVLYPFLRVFS